MPGSRPCSAASWRALPASATWAAAADGAALARELTDALGRLRGPVVKVAQLLATVPGALPAEYVAELMSLQSQAPAMGPTFVRRRMAGELGADWQSRFRAFDLNAAAAASLGQVHRAVATDGRRLACKLQYPDMDVAVDADLRGLDLALRVLQQYQQALTMGSVRAELEARLREELDYALRKPATWRCTGTCCGASRRSRCPNRCRGSARAACSP